MKNFSRNPLVPALAAMLLLPAALLAQPGEKDKEKDKKESQQIIINRNGNKDEKIIVEVNGDKVTVNGKPIEEYKGDDVIVRSGKNKITTFGNGTTSWNFSGDNFQYFNIDSNRAMLGVTTEKSDKGVEIQEITKESGASKAGLKKGDIITKIDDKAITTPDVLSKTIKSHKPGEKVNITYLRDGKEEKVSAELGRWKGTIYTPNYNIDLKDMDLGNLMPKIQTIPRSRVYGQAWSGGTPKLGLSVQDTEDGKGVKVIEVDEESNAEKAGIKENDIITEVEGKAVNSADEVAKIVKDSKDKISVMVKLTRNGKTQNIEVKMPRKLKTADL